MNGSIRKGVGYRYCTRSGSFLQRKSPLYATATKYLEDVMVIWIHSWWQRQWIVTLIRKKVRLISTVYEYLYNIQYASSTTGFLPVQYPIQYASTTGLAYPTTPSKALGPYDNMIPWYWIGPTETTIHREWENPCENLEMRCRSPLSIGNSSTAVMDSTPFWPKLLHLVADRP